MKNVTVVAIEAAKFDKCVWYIAKPGQDGGELVEVTRNRRGYDPIGNRTQHATEADVYALNEKLFGHTEEDVLKIVGSSMFENPFQKLPTKPCSRRKPEFTGVGKLSQVHVQQ